MVVKKTVINIEDCFLAAFVFGDSFATFEIRTNRFYEESDSILSLFQYHLRKVPTISEIIDLIRMRVRYLIYIG